MFNSARRSLTRFPMVALLDQTVKRAKRPVSALGTLTRSAHDPDTPPSRASAGPGVPRSEEIPKQQRQRLRTHSLSAPLLGLKCSELITGRSANGV